MMTTATIGEWKAAEDTSAATSLRATHRWAQANTGSVTGAAATAESPAAKARHAKLVDAAQQFEAVFLNEMLKSSFGSADSGLSGDGESGSGTMQSLGLEAMSKAIANSGGLGIARHIVHDVEAQAARAGR